MANGIVIHLGEAKCVGLLQKILSRAGLARWGKSH